MSVGVDAPLGFRSFEFDLPTALLEQLATVFDGMEQGALTPINTRAIPDGQGVYQLFNRGELVYIGKTDGQAGLRQRLSRHAWTIQSRHGLDVSAMSFKAVQVLVFSALDLETSLIAHYTTRGGRPTWNGSGFGSNDPGRQRDKTKLGESSFDFLYPINIDLPLGIAPPAPTETLNKLLTRVATAIPFTLRIDRTAAASAELRTRSLIDPVEPSTVRNILEQACAALSPGWQATRLAGRVILYREHVDDYPSAGIIARS